MNRIVLDIDAVLLESDQALPGGAEALAAATATELQRLLLALPAQGEPVARELARALFRALDSTR